MVYYLSMEFLMGRSFKNNLYNLDMTSTMEKALKKFGVKLENLYELEPDADAEIISNMETITHKPLGCSAYIYKDKFAADGYLMLHSSKTYAKREQIGNILDTLSCNSMPVKIAKPVKVTPMVTSGENGTMNIMLTNISFDKTGVFECVVRNTKPFSIITDDGKLLPAKQVINGNESVITIDNLDAWN